MPRRPTGALHSLAIAEEVSRWMDAAKLELKSPPRELFVRPSTSD